MDERPILFSGPMVRALLEGRKTQTRRVVKGPIGYHGPRGDTANLENWGWFFDGREHHGWAVLARGLNQRHDNGLVSIPCPYGEPCDKLWVREEHYCFGHWEPVQSVRTRGGRQKWRFAAHTDAGVLYEPPDQGFRRGRHHKDPSTPAWHKRLARFMPRSLSRLTLEVTDVRVERLQSISDADAEAEGCPGAPGGAHPMGDDGTEPREEFKALWRDLHGPGAWESNPWVWAVTFRPVAPGP